MVTKNPKTNEKPSLVQGVRRRRSPNPADILGIGWSRAEQSKAEQSRAEL